MNVMKLINLPSLFTVFRTVIISIKVKPSHFICFTDTRHVMPTSMATIYKLKDRPSSRFSFFFCLCTHIHALVQSPHIPSGFYA